jgi:hypothetical protein
MSIYLSNEVTTSFFQHRTLKLNQQQNSTEEDLVARSRALREMSKLLQDNARKLREDARLVRRESAA